MTPIHQSSFSFACLVVVAAMHGTPTTLAAQSIATYTVEFETTWSAQTHPAGFPGNPHFSPLIGGTHRESIVFWSPGGLASEGIESMAERGSTSRLRAEVQVAIDDGHAGGVLSGGGISPSPGEVSLEFEISSDFPLVTLVSMLAPSPDWFVGVHGLSLLEDGQWIGSLEVPLQVYDAGTDSGANYTAANKNTAPPAPIATLTTEPFDQTGLVGRFSFRQRQTTARSNETPEALVVSAPYPNPARVGFRVDFEGPSRGRVTVRLFDVMGRIALEKRVVGSTGSVRQIRLSLAGMAPGLYFVEIRAAGTVRHTPLTIIR